MREVRGVPDRPGERSGPERGAVSAGARARLAEMARWEASERGEARDKAAQRRIDAIASERDYYRTQPPRPREADTEHGSPPPGPRDSPPSRPGGTPSPREGSPGEARPSARAPDDMFSFLGTPHAHKLDAIRVVGDDYDVKWNRER